MNIGIPLVSWLGFTMSLQSKTKWLLMTDGGLELDVNMEGILTVPIGKKTEHNVQYKTTESCICNERNINHCFILSGIIQELSKAESGKMQ